jgi:hypothetical protein
MRTVLALLLGLAAGCRSSGPPVPDDTAARTGWGVNQPYDFDANQANEVRQQNEAIINQNLQRMR